MEKMVEEWSDMEFTINLYGNSYFFLGPQYHFNGLFRVIPEYSFSQIIYDGDYL